MRLLLFWRTKPAADEFIDLTDSSRVHAINEAVYQAFADADAKVLRVSGKPLQKGKTITAQVERIRPDRCNS